MRPRTIARPAAAGALCFAFTCAGAQTALAQSDTSQSTQSRAHRAGAAHRRAAPQAQRPRGYPHRGARPRRRPASPACIVSLQVKRGRRWKPIDRDRTEPAGRYMLRERLRRTGQPKAARPRGGRARRRRGRQARDRPAQRLPLAECLVVRPRLLRQPHRLRRHARATASWASPTSRCRAAPWSRSSTGRREVRVPVIDRGPYVGGREYDLTAATARRLGFGGPRLRSLGHALTPQHRTARRVDAALHRSVGGGGRGPCGVTGARGVVPMRRCCSPAGARRAAAPAARAAAGAGAASSVLERRHAHAEQPHRARRRVGAQQVDGHAGDRRGVVHRRPGACGRGSPWSSRRGGP